VQREFRKMTQAFGKVHDHDDNDDGKAIAKPPRLFYGWVVLVICILCKVFKCQGQNNFMAYTVPHLLEEFGLSHSELGAIFTVATVSAGFVQPHMGKAFDRYKGRRCMVAAQLALAFTLLNFAAWRKPSWRPFLYVQAVLLFFFLRALALGACETFPNATVQQWFVTRRGEAMAVLNTATGLCHAALAPVVYHLVGDYSWRTCFVAGACANLVLAPLSLLVVRGSPECMGLLPDGDVVPDCLETDVGNAKKKGGGSEGQLVGKAVQEVEEDRGGAGWLGGHDPAIIPCLVFGFVWGVVFGGCDFYMVEIIEDVGGLEGGVNVPQHIFMPLSFFVGLVTPPVSIVMGRFGENPAVLCGFLSLCALMISASNILLTVCTTPLLGLLYGTVRGFVGGIAQPMLSSGLAYAAMGVGRDRIGSVLGLNQLMTLCGTGLGPMVYGTYRDVAGTYRGSLVMTAIPPFMLSVFFGCKAVRSVLSARGLAVAAGAPAEDEEEEAACVATEGGTVKPLRFIVEIARVQPAVLGAAEGSAIAAALGDDDDEDCAEDSPTAAKTPKKSR